MPPAPSVRATELPTSWPDGVTGESCAVAWPMPRHTPPIVDVPDPDQFPTGEQLKRRIAAGSQHHRLALATGFGYLQRSANDLRFFSIAPTASATAPVHKVRVPLRPSPCMIRAELYRCDRLGLRCQFCDLKLAGSLLATPWSHCGSGVRRAAGCGPFVGIAPLVVPLRRTARRRRTIHPARYSRSEGRKGALPQKYHGQVM